MFKLSSKAQRVIRYELSREELAGMISHVTWEDEYNGKITGRWTMGFIERERVAGHEAEYVHEIDGIEIVIDGPRRHLGILKGATLDVKDGRFVFILLH